MVADSNIHKAALILKEGGIIAYPTESCYGFGCLPDNTAGIERILAIKNRSWQKGLILVADELTAFSNYILPLAQIEASALKRAEASWPGPFTWLFPINAACSPLLKGSFDTLAVRLSAHKMVRKLSEACSSAIVSTSANKQGQPAMVSYDQVMTEFNDQLDYVLEGDIGGDTTASEIRDLLTQQLIRGA
ncbi:MAG: L-threonylcarbamoyladenylate synthase [Saprospiraceae bacterium]|jgi:L-threonylcarbamoyladenylate synthase